MTKSPITQLIESLEFLRDKAKESNITLAAVAYNIAITEAQSLLAEEQKELEASRLNGVLLGLKICKEMFAQGQLTHENIYENEVLYKEELENLKVGNPV